MNLEEKVKSEINCCINILSDFLEVKIKEKPRLSFAKRDLSGYNPKYKVISISEKDAGSGISYFEEISHFFRDYIFPQNEKNIKIDEFFGRLGESIGRNLVENTKFAYFFENEKPRNYSNKDFFKEECDLWLNFWSSNIENGEIKRNMFNNSKVKMGLITKFVYDVGNCLTNKDLDFKEIVKIVENYEKCSKGVGFELEFNDLVGKGKNFNELKDDLISCLERYKMNKNNYKKIINTYEKLKTFSNKNGENLRRMKKHIKRSRLVSKNRLEDLYCHLIGYTVAEQFIKNDTEFMEKAPIVFRQNNETIYNYYFLSDFMKPYYLIIINSVLRKFLEMREKKLFRHKI